MQRQSVPVVVLKQTEIIIVQPSALI